MVESEIRQLLNGVSRSSMIHTVPGFVALLTSQIESAGGDLDEIREWASGTGRPRRKIGSRAISRAAVRAAGCTTTSLRHGRRRRQLN